MISSFNPVEWTGGAYILYFVFGFVVTVDVQALPLVKLVRAILFKQQSNLDASAVGAEVRAQLQDAVAALQATLTRALSEYEESDPLTAPDVDIGESDGDNETSDGGRYRCRRDALTTMNERNY